MLFFLILSAGMFTVSSAATPAVAAGPNEMYQGKIAAITDKGLTVVGRRGENLSFAVAADCMVLLDGKQVPVNVLGVGLTVQITAAIDGGVRIAKQIHARTLEASQVRPLTSLPTQFR